MLSLKKKLGEIASQMKERFFSPEIFSKLRVIAVKHNPDLEKNEGTLEKLMVSDKIFN